MEEALNLSSDRLLDDGDESRRVLWPTNPTIHRGVNYDPVLRRLTNRSVTFNTIHQMPILRMRGTTSTPIYAAGTATSFSGVQRSV